MSSSAWFLLCGALVLLAGAGYMAVGNEGGAGWLILFSGVGMVVSALLTRRQENRSGRR